jgi:hypothetical protein
MQEKQVNECMILAIFLHWGKWVKKEKVKDDGKLMFLGG